MSEPMSEKTEKLAEALTDLGEEINSINRANGWNVCIPEDWLHEFPHGDQTYKLCTTMALIHSEVSEATEAIRKRDRENFEEELADVFIRVMDCAHGLGINLAPVIRAKLDKNKNRGYRHGGKKC